jgi:GT2 family glycosyltransferase
MAMSEYSVSLSIVTYNSEDHIEEALDSIISNTRGVDCHIYVIDNCSKDRTVEIIKNRYGENVTLIQNPKNLGFGRGHNVILDRIQSKYHAYVNPDVLIKDDVVSSLCRYLDQNEDIGLVTPKVLYPTGEPQILPKRNPKLLYLLSRKINIRPLKKYREEFEMRNKDMNSAFDIEFCTGCFMFARTSLLKKIGGFDERFFLYFEDADLSRKIRRLARTQYNPDFQIYHYWERASSKKLKYFFLQIKSMFQYLKKWKKES